MLKGCAKEEKRDILAARFRGSRFKLEASAERAERLHEKNTREEGNGREGYRREPRF